MSAPVPPPTPEPDDPERATTRNPWLWATAAVAVLAIALGVWALNERSNADDAKADLEAQQQTATAPAPPPPATQETQSQTVTQTQTVASDESRTGLLAAATAALAAARKQLNESDAQVEDLEAEVDDANAEADKAAQEAEQAKQDAAAAPPAEQAKAEAEQAQAEERQAGAKAKAAASCAKAMLEIVGQIPQAESPEAGLQSASEEITALVPKCKESVTTAGGDVSMSLRLPTRPYLHTHTREGEPMPTLMVDFIISLDGYGSAEGWPGFWGMEVPEYLDWIGQESENEHTTLMGATTYRLMSGFATEMPDEAGLAELTAMRKVVFSSTLEEPLGWANSELVAGDAVAAVQDMKQRELAAPAHARQRQPLPVAARSRPRGPLPRRRLPRHHRRHREGPHLRRVSRRRPRPRRAPHVRRFAAAARVRAHGARRPARRMTTVEVNGVALGVEHFGDATAPLVLLAGGTTMLSWPDALCEALARGGRHVVRYDLRDSGASTTADPEAPAYTLRDLAADAAALARALDDRPAHLAGIGVGGMVAQVAALDHPDAFSALTLAGTRPVAPGRPDEDLPDHDAATMERLFSRPMPDWSDRAAVAQFAADGAEVLGDDPAAARATAERIWDRTPGTDPAVQRPTRWAWCSPSSTASPAGASACPS